MDERASELSKQRDAALKKLVELENEYDKRVKEGGFSGESGGKAVVLPESYLTEMADMWAEIEKARQDKDATSAEYLQYLQSHPQ